LILALGPGVVLAQGLAPAQLEEITVTARKREQSLQDVGITMAALGAAQLRALNAQSLPDLTAALPNVELFEDYGGHGLPVWVIRGVGLQDFNANNTPAAAVFVDEVYQASSVMGNVGLFDAERVEVLKGPQGGLYGRNTSGGAINFHSRRPVHGDYDGHASANHGRWDSWDFQAASNLPLNERTTLRVAGNRQFSNDAWQSSWPSGQIHGEKDLWNARMWLLWDATDATTVQWKLYAGANNSELNLGRAIGLYKPDGSYCAAVLAGVRDDSSCLTLAGVAAAASGQTPVFPSVQASDGATSMSQAINQLHNEQAGSTLIIEHEFSGARLTSISNVEAFRYGADFDFDGTPLELGHNLGRSDIDVWSQELRLTNTTASPLSWLAGIYLAREDFAENRDFRLADSIVSPLQLGRLSFDQESRSFAVYGSVGYRFSDAWSVDTTLRYNNEDKYYRNGTMLAPAFPAPMNVLASGLRSDYELDSKLSGSVMLSYTPTEDLLWYGSVSRGFKAGGFYGGFPLQPGATDPYGEETVLAYEAGFKAALGEQLQLNAATFHYDYRDVQGYVTRFSAITGTDVELLANQGDAEHSGVEVELQWLATDRLSLTLSGAHLDARITDSKADTNNLLRQRVPVAGRRSYAPEWSAFAALQYRYPLADGMQLAGNLDYNYRSDFTGATYSVVDRAVFALNEYALMNAALTLTPAAAGWSMMAWVRNLTNERYVPRVVFDSFGDFIDIPGEPRSWGLKIEKYW